MAAVLEIEMNTSSPWSSAAILEEFGRKGGLQYVAVREGSEQVIGWCCALLVAGEAELLKITVEKTKRLRGVATTLLSQLVGDCFIDGVTKLFLEVRASNQPARIFYERHGFRKLHIRTNYYRDPKEDAIIYEKILL